MSGHVIVGGRALVQMLTDTSLAHHILVGARRAFPLGHTWFMVGDKMFQTSEVMQLSMSGQSNVLYASLSASDRLCIDRLSDIGEFGIQTCKSSGNVSHQAAYVSAQKEMMRLQNEKSLKQLYEASKDIAQAAGWALSGDHAQATEKAVDAAVHIFQATFGEGP